MIIGRLKQSLLLWTAFLLVAWHCFASPNVAVIDFTTAPGANHEWSWAAVGLGDLFQVELQQLGATTLDRDSIHAVLAEQRLAATGLTAKDYVHIGGLLNATYLMAGHLTPLAEGRFRIDVTIFSVEAIETIATVSAEGLFPGELPDTLKSVARQAFRHLPSTTGMTAESPVNPPPKPESLIMFYRGLNACTRGEPEAGVAYFMNAEDLEPGFVAPFLWEIKAYELAGLGQFAAIRRAEAASMLERAGLPAEPANHPGDKPVFAVLNPVSIGNSGLATMEVKSMLQQTLLDTGRVRLFAFEDIGHAMAEQDLKLSSLFSSQFAPRYGRWLASDALVTCRITKAPGGRIVLELALVNPVTGKTEARVEKSGEAKPLKRVTKSAVIALLQEWNKRQMSRTETSQVARISLTDDQEAKAELRPEYIELATRLEQVEQTSTPEVHQALANAFGATGHEKLAAHEIEQCLKSVDMRAPGSDVLFFGLHRWLFWEPNPVGGAVGLVSPNLIDGMVEQLFADYPGSLCSACMHYNRAVEASHVYRIRPAGEMKDDEQPDWAGTIEQATAARRILEDYAAAQAESKEPAGRWIVKNNGPYPKLSASESEIVAATYYLEGLSLRKLGRTNEAIKILQNGKAFIEEYKVRDFCLPLGPCVSCYNDIEEIPGYGGDAPGMRTRIRKELAIIVPGSEEVPSVTATIIATNSTPPDWIKIARDFAAEQHASEALDACKHALAGNKPPMDCAGLGEVLLDLAFQENPDDPAAGVEHIRARADLPPVEATWPDYFRAGRKFQKAGPPDFYRAAAAYRAALHFLENPGEHGLCHLESNPPRVILRWGPDLNEVDLQWSDNYDRRYYSAAFYLAQCLIQLNQKEEAARWLRKIAINVAADSSIPLLDRDEWNSSGWTDGPSLGIRAAELLQHLHHEAEAANLPSH